MSSANEPSSPSSRSRSSSAARRVKVIARQRSGKTFSSAQRYAIRCVSVRVLPVPGPATISIGPPGRRGRHPLHRVEAVEQAGADLLHPRQHRLERLVRRRRHRDRRRGRRGRRLARTPLTARRARGRRRRCGRLGGALPRHGSGRGHVEERLGLPGAAGRRQLRRREEPDHAVLAVVAGDPLDLAAAQPPRSPRRAARHRPGRSRPAATRSGSAAPGRARRPGGSASPRRSWTAAPTPLSSPRISASGTRCATGRASSGRYPAGRSASSSTPAEHADRHRLAAPVQVPPAARVCSGRPVHPARPVPVGVVLALLREELDRAGQPVAGAQRVPDGEVVERGGEARRLPGQRRRGVRVGVGDQPVPVEARRPASSSPDRRTARSPPRRCGRPGRRSSRRSRRSPTWSRARRTTASRCAPARGNRPGWPRG